jgi:hypothetical protein
VSMRFEIASLCLVLFCSSAAFCAPGPGDLAAYKNAGAKLVSLIEAAQQAGQISQLKTPEVMGLVKTISDEKRILRPGSYTADELGSLMDVCGVANQASVSLALFNLKAHVGAMNSQEEMQAQTVALMNRNTVAFQEELGQLQPFLLRCLAKEIEPMTQFVASLKPADFTVVRRQGLAQARSGLLQIYTGAFQAANDTRYNDTYRTSLLAALSEISGRFATIMELSVRGHLRDSARSAASQASGAYKTHLVRIADSLNSETCDGLCAIH